jgi:YfiH family protein
MPGWPLLKLKQVHSGIVRTMKDTWAANEPVEGDAAITDLRGAALCVQTADCVPILIADRSARCVAAVHAGWRGAAAGIARTTVNRMVEEYSVAAADLIAAIGPHNAVCCYEVGEDVVEAISDSDSFIHRSEWRKPHLDQARANRRQLIDAGIPEDQITVSNLCTQCSSDLLFSHRREGARAGRMLAVIALAS